MHAECTEYDRKANVIPRPGKAQHEQEKTTYANIRKTSDVRVTDKGFQVVITKMLQPTIMSSLKTNEEMEKPPLEIKVAIKAQRSDLIASVC